MYIYIPYLDVCKYIHIYADIDSDTQIYVHVCMCITIIYPSSMRLRVFARCTCACILSSRTWVCWFASCTRVCVLSSFNCAPSSICMCARADEVWWVWKYTHTPWQESIYTFLTPNTHLCNGNACSGRRGVCGVRMYLLPQVAEYMHFSDTLHTPVRWECVL